MDLRTFKIVVPCLYEPETEQTNNTPYPNRKIALARELPNRNIVIDVYKIGSGKVASKTFTQNEVSWMLRFMEQQLGVNLYIPGY